MTIGWKVSTIVAAQLALVVACVTTPVTQRRQLILFNAGQMASLGRQSFADVLQREPISQDPQINATVDRITERLLAAADEDESGWKFAVIDRPETINAFALPGGRVAIFTGLLPVAANEAGLATVIGHEIGHVIARHGAERMTQATLAQAGLTVADVALRSNEHRNIILPALGMGAQLGVILPYSRLHESEADAIGLTLMAKAGYDPREAVALWERMGEVGGSRQPEFLATHPSPDTRQQRLSDRVGEALELWARSDKQPTRSLLAH
jgi:predicted Zn-dependent protease